MHISNVLYLLLFCCTISLIQCEQYFVLKETHQIDLSAPPQTRFTQVAKAKKEQLTSFINYLKSEKEYGRAFRVGKLLQNLWEHLIDKQFYLECKSMAQVLECPVSQLIVFNYMYQLGAYHKFCTSIAVKSKGQYFLARNLDYGYQKYLLDNSIIFEFVKDGKVLIKAVGHAGFVGLHSGIRINHQEANKNYALSLNQRVEEGLHITLWKMLLLRAPPMIFWMRKTLEHHEDLIAAYHQLESAETAAPAYFILSGRQSNILIEKSRFESQGVFVRSDPQSYIVQTNTDLELPDPDRRRDTAISKMQNLFSKELVNPETVLQLLSQSPNKNSLTILTVVMNPIKSDIYAQAWLINQDQ